MTPAKDTCRRCLLQQDGALSAYVLSTALAQLLPVQVTLLRDKLGPAVQPSRRGLVVDSYLRACESGPGGGNIFVLGDAAITNQVRRAAVLGRGCGVHDQPCRQLRAVAARQPERASSLAMQPNSASLPRVPPLQAKSVEPAGELFRQGDVDGDGKLSPDELHATLLLVGRGGGGVSGPLLHLCGLCVACKWCSELGA